GSRGGTDPLAGPLGQWLYEKRVGKIHLPGIVRIPDHRERRSRNASIAHHPLRHSLVEGEGENERVREGVGNVPGIEQCRHLSLTPDPPQAFGDVEHELPPVAGDETCREMPHMPDPIDLHTAPGEHIGDGIDGGGRIELGGFFLAVAFGEILVAEVVCEADAHQPALPPTTADDPRSPPGSGYRQTAPSKLRRSRSSPSRPTTGSGIRGILPPPPGASMT